MEIRFERVLVLMFAASFIITGKNKLRKHSRTHKEIKILKLILK